MPARKRHRGGSYPADIFMTLDGARRVGWAKYFEEAGRNDQLQHANDVLVDRIETVLPKLIELKDAVLYERNIQAFCAAWRVQQIIDEFEKGRRT